MWSKQHVQRPWGQRNHGTFTEQKGNQSGWSSGSRGEMMQPEFGEGSGIVGLYMAMGQCLGVYPWSCWSEGEDCVILWSSPRLWEGEYIDGGARMKGHSGKDTAHPSHTDPLREGTFPSVKGESLSLLLPTFSGAPLHLLLSCFCIFSVSFLSLVGPSPWPPNMIKSLRRTKKNGWVHYGTDTPWIIIQPLWTGSTASGELEGFPGGMVENQKAKKYV